MPYMIVLPMCLAPLPAVLLISVGLIILKRRPAWVSRLVAPPFYLVSLPIATLIAGAVMLGLYVRLLSLGASADYHFFLNSYFYYVFYPLLSGHYVHVLVGSFVGFWVAIFVSGYLLWQTVWRQHGYAASSRIVGQRLRGLLLLVCFAWAFVYLVAYIVLLTTPLGISDNHG